MSETIRSFIAFDIEESSVLKCFSNVQNILINTGANLKIVKPENIHITMRFLGNVPVSMIELIHEEIKRVFFSPFDIEVHGVGVFPNLRRPRVVWAGIRSGAEELKNIFYQLETCLQRLGFKKDSKGFSPHLTLLRVKNGRRREELEKNILALADYEFGVVKVNCLKIKKSVLTPRGPVYSTLREVCSTIA